MAGRKRSHCFAVTINHVTWSKSCLGAYLTAGELVKRLVVGEKHYHLPLDCDTGAVLDTGDIGVHHHVFIDFVEKYFLAEVRDIMLDFLGGEEYSIDIQVCRSPKSWLIYLSKEDRQPFLYNVRVSELSLFARAWYHARTEYRTIKPINKADVFICSLGQNARFAISIVEQHLNELRTQEAPQRVTLEPNRRCGQVREILDVLNDGVSHLYIDGPPGCGKTEIVDYFLKGKHYWKAGEPSAFLFGTLSDSVDSIWFEDFNLWKYSGHLNTLLSLMDHKETTVSK